LGKAYSFLCWENSWHDFSTIFHFSKALYENKVERPYTTEGQLETYEHWLHEPRAYVMPVSYFPTCFQLWGSLSFLSVQQAFLLWNLLGASIAFMVTREFQKTFSPLKGSLLSMVIFLSSAGYCAFFFGQTGLLFTGLLILLSKPPFSSQKQSIFTSWALLVLLSKPPGAVLGWSLLIVQKRWREFFLSLIAPALITAIFCHQHGGVQTLLDYIHWIRSCNVVSIGENFSKAITPLFQSNWIALATEKTSFTPATIYSLNQILLFGGFLLGIIFMGLKKINFTQAPLWLGWLYLLFSPYLVITEDLIAGWIAYQWIIRQPKRLPFAVAWLFLLLNTSQTHSLFFSDFFYHHPVSWGIKLIGFAAWLGTEICNSKPGANSKTI
jgi:hypothetical protein